MSDYSKATNFTAKDSLPSGNSNKIVKGSEIDNEFIAISSAIASKADINSPTFTGTPAAPTATAGSNTTQIANTAFVKAAFDTLGSMSTQNSNAVAITGGTISGVTVASLATDVTVADGGTGASTFTQNSVVLGNGTAPLNGNMVAPGTVGNVLTSNGTTWVSAAFGGTRGQVFTSSGTFTVPSGVTTLKATVVGGGGNGGRADFDGSAGGGGGGGGVSTRYITGLTPGGTVTATVGGISGTSSFGSFVSATGGGGGGNGFGGGVGGGGAGGTGSSGDINIPGGNGGNGYRDEGQNGGGGAGGAAGGGNGNYGFTAPFLATGGGGAFGRGGYGTAGDGFGTNGVGFGSGGGGSFSSGGGSRAGSSGTAGIIILEW